MKEKGIPFTPAVTWTSDGFFRETKEKIKARRRAGCNVVDMEAAALAACARFRGKEFAQILFTADTLSSLSHDPRGWGYRGRNAALEIGLAAAQVM